jgi:hypothetical protein
VVPPRRAPDNLIDQVGKASLKRRPPMALSQSAVSELLEAFRAGDGADLIRESVRIVLQELIETEAAQVVGAERYPRTRRERG